MSANVYVIEDYENEPPSGPKKTNPIQTQFRKAKMNKKSGHTREFQFYHQPIQGEVQRRG